MKAFKLTADGLMPEGTICFPFRGFDYGMAAEDTAHTGVEHRSYTLLAFGGAPSFTHPVRAVCEIEVPDILPPDEDHAKTVCKIGQGGDCCKYLAMAPSGWSCEKLSPAGLDLALRKDMLAKGDNCAGRAPRG